MKTVKTSTNQFHNIEYIISLLREFTELNPDVTSDIATLVGLHTIATELSRRYMMRKKSIYVEIKEKDLDEVMRTKVLTIK